MQFEKTFSLRLAASIFIGIIIFFAGVLVGYRNQPETAKISGVVNITQTASSTTATGSTQLKTCIDNQGNDVPCLADQSGMGRANGGIADFNQFWTAWNVINEKYVPTKHKSVTNEEKVWGAISGLANSLGDPYTYFLPPQENTLFTQDVKGEFGGIGMQIGLEDGVITSLGTLKNSPAERAGIEKGDKVLKIDDATTTNMSIDKALYLIRGEVGKPVHLTLYREGRNDLIEVAIIREIIQIPTVDTEKRDDVFIIRLHGFPETGPMLFRKALREFIESGADKLVLDVRGNPGGYIEVAVDIASWFLPQGKVVVREEEKGGTGRVYRSVGYDIFTKGFHFVVLIDGGSASAAEILAAALSQHHVATLVGKKTFGKGSVQELIPITNDTALKLTVARWITPDGTSLSEGGINPQVEVDLTREQYEKGKDPQLDKAIEILHSANFAQ